MTDALPDISICVPVWKPHVEPNVRMLGESLDAALDGLSGELIVALNGVDAKQAEVPDDARVVDLGRNRGVSVGWNRAAECASGEILCFANDDVALGPGSLRLLWDALRNHPEAGVVGPVGTRWDIVRGQHESWLDTGGLNPGATLECEVVSGFLFATPRALYEQSGGFDEFYAPASWEEVDYCTWARLEAGRRCYAVAGVDQKHEFGISRRQMPWRRISWDGRSESIWSIGRRNRRHFLAKWRERAAAAA